MRMKLVRILKGDVDDAKDPIAFLEDKGYVKVAPNIYHKDKSIYQVQVALSGGKWISSVSIAEEGGTRIVIDGVARAKPSEAIKSMKETAAKKLTSYVNSIWAL